MGVLVGVAEGSGVRVGVGVAVHARLRLPSTRAIASGVLGIVAVLPGGSAGGILTGGMGVGVTDEGVGGVGVMVEKIANDPVGASARSVGGWDD